jgi:hypothetical protein
MAIASSVGVSEVMLAGMLTESEMFMQTNRSQKIVGTYAILPAGYEISTLSKPMTRNESLATLYR